MDLKKLAVPARVRSAQYAVQGLWTLVCTQPNTWYMIAAAAGVVAAGFAFRVSRLEWCSLATAILLVWCAEALNTAVEFLTDLASKDPHPLAKNAKDVAAAAVLMAVLYSIVIAALVFGPRLIALLK